MSKNWLAGYSTDVAYILGYYRELAPHFLNYGCLVNGVQGLPDRKNIRYCELGCGRGYATTLMAAANPDMTFVGVDFNPTHIAEANALASRVALPNLSFREMSFEEAASSNDPDLGEFDIMAMHGVYSWITPDVRDDLHKLILAKLIPGGILFVSYNTMPGWASVGPVQRLIREMADRSSGDALALFDSGFKVLQILTEKSSAFIAQNPALKERVEQMRLQNKRYLAHEFLNAGWGPLYVTDAMAMLADAKLGYVGSAGIAENRLALSVKKDFHELVRSAPDVAMRELFKDYAVNKLFRRDIYVKGAQRLTLREQHRRISETTFTLTCSVDDIPDKLHVPAGELAPKEDFMEALIMVLAGAPALGSELIAAGENAGARRDGVMVLLEALVHNSVVCPARADHDSVDRSASHRLNALIMGQAATSDAHRFLASPVLGSAVKTRHVDRLTAPVLLPDMKQSDRSVAEIAQKNLSTSGLKLRKDAQNDGERDDLDAIQECVSEFRGRHLSTWRRLGLIPGDQ